MEIREIVARLNDQAQSVCRSLLPNGVREGHEWRVGDLSGAKGKSLAVHLSGAKTGVWRDFAGEQGGDLLELWRLTRGITIGEALKEAKRWLGITETFKPKTKQFAKPQKPKGLKKPKPESPVFEYLIKQRGLSKDTLERFKIGEAIIGYEFVDGKPTFTGPSIVFPYLDEEGRCLNISYIALDRPKGKKYARFAVSGAEMCLFGWQAVDPNARTIIISEGQIDAMSWREYGYEALSIPHGIGAMEWIENEWERLERFETIYVSVDNEETSQKQVPKLFERLGYDRCLNVTLPFKDINKCLTEGVSQSEIDECVESATAIDPEGLRRHVDYTEDVIRLFTTTGTKEEPGYSLSFEERVRIRPAEFTVIFGESNAGKTTIMRQILLDAIIAGNRCCGALLEDPPPRTFYRFVRQALGERHPSEDAIRRTMRWLRDWYIPSIALGTGKVKRLLTDWEYAWKRYGVTQFVLDNVSKVDIAADDYPAQQALMNELAEFTQKTNGHVFLLNHTNKQMEDGAVPGARDQKGSGSFRDLAHNVFAVQRNSQAVEQAAREAAGMRKRQVAIGDHNGSMRIIKHKNTDSDTFEALIKLYFHADCYIFTARKDDSPFLYVDSIPADELVLDTRADYVRF